MEEGVIVWIPVPASGLALIRVRCPHMATLAHVLLRSTLYSENREVISTGQEVEAENSQGHGVHVCGVSQIQSGNSFCLLKQDGVPGPDLQHPEWV